ncbi:MULTISPECIES: polysaccharide deacetylase family protein [unclassified Streptomyces]|uniref:polysaccharide deacetylase family protein n=1 Tax=unclassified Streptomyces TaxID=2593676 RepID=UPI002366FB8B|nr:MULTISPECIES: polysaccharide deacetylase family protein [unclassified Streptomyces]MDF3145154.1 polysaccharide deacetylase family protein [Streptomyces sp. T21Q-yed]WDF42089.1 polysaccharide deacetylase family protein [Streptomyces sp. T12]
MPRHALAPVLFLLGSLALTAACSTGSSPADSAPSPDRPSRIQGNDAGTQVDLTNLKGVSIVSDSSTDRSCPWATSYPDVPGADQMTAVMKKDVQNRLAVFLGEDTDGQVTDCGGMEGSEGPELNVSFSFLVVSGDVLGVRLTTVDRTSNADGVDTEAYWYDGAAQRYRPSPGLIADGSRDAFVAAVKERLEKREGVTPDTVTALDDPDAYLDDMAFTADGDLKVDFDRGTVGVPPAGRISVTLPKATVTPWLSDFGSRAQHQSTDPDDKLDLGAAHTPAPTVAAQPDPGEDTTDCSKVKCIALTFDDGPAAPETGTLLKYLAEYKARATFFVVGQNVATHPDIVRAEMKSGHEIANHSWNHPVLTNLTPGQVRSQLERTNAAIKDATGQEPTLFRPPYGAIDGKVRAATSLSPALWDVDTEDWKFHDPGKVARTVVSQAEPNDVVLIHDIHPTSVAAVPEVLRTLTARGYHFVTVSHLRATL